MVSDFEALARLVPGEPVVLMSVLYHFCMSVRGEVPVVGRPGKKKYKTENAKLQCILVDSTLQAGTPGDVHEV